MWEALFSLLGKLADAATSIWGRKRRQTALDEPVDAQAARAGTVAGGAAYTAGRRAGKGGHDGNHP